MPYAELNPEWRDAPYEIQFALSNGKMIYDQYPNRFKVCPPVDLPGEQMMAWIFANRIPMYRVVDKPKAEPKY